MGAKTFAGRMAWCWYTFREDPKSIPQVIPDGEEASRDELPEVWREPECSQPVNYKVIHDEIYQSDNHVAGCDFSQFALEVRISEDPVALQHEVNAPADDISSQLGPP